MTRPPRKLGLTEDRVLAALQEANGSPTEAARILGVVRNTVIYWMRTRNLSRSVEIVKREVRVTRSAGPAQP